MSTESMICKVPGDFRLPSGTELPLDLPVEAAFSDSQFHPWTTSSDKFRLYE